MRILPLINRVNSELKRLSSLAKIHEKMCDDRKTWVLPEEFFLILDSCASLINLNVEQGKYYCHELEYGGHVFVTHTPWAYDYGWNFTVCLN